MQHREKKRMLTHARGLRRSMTAAERRLWQILRRHGLDGLKWRRQVPWGWYVLDFYCPSARLVVELDGAHHQRSAIRAEDVRRDLELRAAGIRVLRLSNEEVLFALPKVVERIRQLAGTGAGAVQRSP